MKKHAIIATILAFAIFGSNGAFADVGEHVLISESTTGAAGTRKLLDNDGCKAWKVTTYSNKKWVNIEYDNDNDDTRVVGASSFASCAKKCKQWGDCDAFHYKNGKCVLFEDDIYELRRVSAKGTKAGALKCTKWAYRDDDDDDDRWD